MEIPENISRVAVMGARGQMGVLFTGRLRGLGIPVLELNRPYGPENLGGLGNVDLLIVSVPVPAMAPVLEAAAPHLSPETVVADVCSVKVRPLAEMLAAWNGPVVGTHPLFGGVIPEGFTPKVAVTPGRGEKAAALVSDLLSRMGFFPFTTTAEEHDRAMALVQGLNFTTTVSYFAALRQMDDVENFLTPSLKRRLDSARKMLTEDRELFTILAETNPFSQDAVRQFRNYLQLAAGGDLDLLAERAGWWFGPKRDQ